MQLEIDVSKKFPEFSCHLQCSLQKARCGVFGPSGSGKSTLMNMIAGLLNPDKGYIRLNGKTLFDSTAGINLPPEARRVGVVFQHAHLFPHMSVEKNLFYGLKRTPRDERHIDPTHLIQALHLSPLLRRNVTRLSGGERQRVALGRTILASPHLILLDEPLTGLDGQLKYQIIPHLNKVFEEFNIPMLFISHSIREMRLMTDQVLIVQQGCVKNTLRTEEMARDFMGLEGQGYVNMLDLSSPKTVDDLLEYRWGTVPLTLVKEDNPGPGQFELDARDILLFKKHPQATSARNMLPCTVKKMFQVRNRVGVELNCQGQSLVAQIVPRSVLEMNLTEGCNVVAVFKASSLQRLY
ncbi:molybdenum ABC transporter ATP-binding protein [Desulfogranum japonicum]|uniref:molybdenum ABC transporter ATP-binding protein n=1 Tax=Desulfogranum japonicum TaxID=231447 RepID=UPI000419F972|nr:molybdenum ABC transporter ATP-binding protein [Desulfogranum japonicum]